MYHDDRELKHFKSNEMILFPDEWDQRVNGGAFCGQVVAIFFNTFNTTTKCFLFSLQNLTLWVDMTSA